jgi:hypothetical protein
MSTAAFASAVTALAGLFTGAAPLAGVTVTNSPAPAAQAAGDYVIVGHDGTLNPDGTLSEFAGTGTFTQQQARFDGALAGSGKDETGAINCVATSETGDTADLPGRLARVQVLLAACEDACVNVQSGTVVFDGTGTAQVMTRQTGAGCAAILAFTISYSAPW